MEEKFIHFLSKESCILNINGENAGIIDNINNMELDIICNKSIYVTYTPISKQLNIPYTFLLNIDKKISCDNKYIKVIPFPNNHFDIIMKPFYYYQVTNSQVLANTVVGKFFLSIVSDTTTQITLLEGNNIVLNIRTIPFKSARYEMQKDNLIIEGVIEDNQYYLIIINTKTLEVIYNDISHSIEKNNGIITTLKKLNSITNHAEVFTFNFENNTKDSYYVYNNNIPSNPTHSLLIPNAFLESVITLDHSLSKKYLHNIHKNTPIEKFKDYFGDIKKIYLNRHQIIEDKINYTLLIDNHYKNYNFIMEDNKIKDIEEIF